MTRVTAVWLTFVALMVVPGCGGEDKRHKEPGRDYNVENQFSVVPPSGWTQAKAVMGTFMMYTAPPDAGFTPNFNVNVNEETTVPEQVMPGLKKTLGELLDKYQPADEGFLTIDGKKALFLSGKFEMGKNKLQNLQCQIYTGTHVYTLTFTCTQDTFAKYRPIFEKAALTARVR